MTTGKKTCLLFGAVIAILLLSVFVAKSVISPQRHISPNAGTYAAAHRVNESLEGMVQLVASEFRCACGGCGELPLIDCNCDMPRGAVEEKRFIREKLEEGLPPQQVIKMVEELYGYKIIG